MEKTIATSFRKNFNSIFDIFYLSGESISMHLLRYSGIRGEILPTRPNPLHLQSLDAIQPTPRQSQLMNNSG